ncbi:hypothetical protein JYT87_02560 [Nitrospira defluvii]|nr:hypothetical protein [Nitrospira defluvii]
MDRDPLLINVRSELFRQQLEMIISNHQVLRTIFTIRGSTIISNLSGKGQHGVHTAHLMFNEMDSMQMVIAIFPEVKVDAVLAGSKPILHRHTGIMLVSDVSVSRPEHFMGKPKD